MDMYFELAMCNGAEDEVKLFEKLFQQCCDYSQPQIARMRIFKFLEEMYYALDSIMAAYDFHPEAKKYPDRFTKVGAKAKTFEDGINYEVPAEKGLYFIGETHFNPITDEKYYWVKVGKASNLKNRMKSYNTHNPMMWRIGFNNEYDKEEYYHEQLQKVAIAKCNHNEEWFLVDRITYLEMCEKGFSYFS